MERSQELDQRKEYVKKYKDEEDWLIKDPPVYNQNYFILSYLLPSSDNEIDSPIFKVRGSFNTIEECNKRIEKLKNIDPYFDMFICTVGEFGSLISKKEIYKMDDIDIQYRESKLNKFVKEYKENKNKADEEYFRRKELLRKKAEHFGSKEGRQESSNNKPNPVGIKTTVEVMQKHKKELEEKLKDVNEIIESNIERLKDYTEEEIKEAEEIIKQEQNEEFSLEK